MNRRGYFRLLALGLVITLISGLGSLLALGWLSHSISSKHRGEFLLFLANSVEVALHETYPDSITTPETAERIREALHMHRPPGPPPPRHHERRGPGPRPDFWIFTAEGLQVYFEGENPGRVHFSELPRPANIHEIAVSDGFLHLGTETAVIRLDFDQTLYLVVRDEHRPSFGPLFFTQAVITLGALAIAIIVALSVLFYYLRRKSREARDVLKRLEHGDLKARFTIRPFDEFGGLLLDFNRMADAIEKLVDRVHATESARKNLLAELGHDLRTPLTSLTTSFETVKLHSSAMSGAQRSEVFAMMEAEVHYVRELLESLMVIASLHEPNFKAETEIVNLLELLTEEVDQRRRADPKLNWQIVGEETELRADPHLIQRLFRNAFDNAARFAKSKVYVELRREGGQAVVKVRDDGHGFSAESLLSFGKRQEKRTLRGDRVLNFSLGLGSVIMKAIADLHAGSVSVENTAGGGAEVTVRLPLQS